LLCVFADYSNVSWKRAQPAPLSLNKNSAGYRQPVGGAAAGRTDWAAKYVPSTGNIPYH